MTAKRKLPPAPIARSAARLALTSSDPRSRTYPRLAELLREPALTSVLRGAVLGGAALSAVALSGCEPPECQATRLDEFSTHTGQAFALLGQLELKLGATELGVGLGVTPHPASYMMAGMMIGVTPTPLPVTPVTPAEPAPGADDEAAPAPPAGPSLPAPQS